jgi:hypothetical protein
MNASSDVIATLRGQLALADQVNVLTVGSIEHSRARVERRYVFAAVAAIA